jgi:hypothetical protein
MSRRFTEKCACSRRSQRWCRESVRAALLRSVVAGCTASMTPVWPPSYTAGLPSSSLSGSAARRSASR